MAIKVCGIYKIIIKNKEEHFYIGSASDINRRWKHHLDDLRRGNHHSPVLQRCYAKYGENGLGFLIIEECAKNDLLIREQYYIDTWNPPLNCCKIAGSTLGIKQSDEFCINQSKRLKGKHHTEEWNKNIGLGHIGKTASKETRNKQSLAKLGKPSHNKGKNKENYAPLKKMSETKKGNCNQDRIGHKDSDETKRKKSEAQKGEKNWAFGITRSKEFCDNLSMKLQGHPAWNKGLTKETHPSLRQMSEAQIGKPGNRKGKKMKITNQLANAV